ncbi:hypothetical protein [Actinoplanes subtropicus]|uniref:hypothetical protein n=1 Tax=Actinoplanes subtropicus TaxID=543632 RepID=UPI0004C471ED|nr:hypothetical protein [Actinoplanes subtropicus]
MPAFDQAFQFGADAFGVFGLDTHTEGVADVLGPHRVASGVEHGEDLLVDGDLERVTRDDDLRRATST